MPFPDPNTESNARCSGCGHPLAGLAEAKCPECGHAFRFDDPASWASTDSPWLARRLRRPPGPVTFTLLTAFCLVLPWQSSHLIRPFEFPWYVFAGILLGIVIVIRCLPAAASSLKAWIRHHPQPRHAGLRWTFLAAIPALAISLTCTPAPRRLRWRLSEPSLRAHAEDLLRTSTSNRTGSSDRTFGLIRITRHAVLNGRVHLFTDTHDFPFYTVVLLYAPPGTGPLDRGTPIGDRWVLYRVEE